MTGFTNPPIGKALAFDHREQLVVALGIGDLERGAAIVTEIELGKVAVQVSLATMSPAIAGAVSRSRAARKSFTRRG